VLFGQIISKAREDKGYSLRELAGRVNTSAATLSKIENLDHIPRDKLIKRLIEELDLDPTSTWGQVARQRITHYHAEVEIDAAATPLSPVPIVGFVTAGATIEAPEWEDGGYPAGSGFDAEMVPLRPDERGLYGLTVDGDSMEPVFSRGDYVFAAPNKEPRNNGYAVIRLKSGEVLLKKVLFQGDLVICQSANPAYPTITVPRSELVYIHPITIHRLR
jgi:phage repressor protein C with HTH and peptisase S24 domain